MDVMLNKTVLNMIVIITPVLGEDVTGYGFWLGRNQSMMI